jgi:hypothetical protein
MTFDPEEVVTCPGRGQVTLRTAVKWVMEQSTKDPGQYQTATIFRDGNPSILGMPHIRKLAAEWGLAP